MSNTNQQSTIAVSIARKKRSSSTNLYVKNFGKEMDESKLCQLFATCDIITSCKIQTNYEGQSKGFGFVDFETPEMAQDAINKLNGYPVEDGKHLFVGPFQTKTERQEEIRRLRNENRVKKSQNLCLYISNLDMTIDDRHLEEAFAQFGTVTHVHIMRSGSQSKGIGFVCFESVEEATKAIIEMNGKWLGSKPLYVRLSEHKEDHQLPLTNQPTQDIPPSNMTYPPRAPLPFSNIPTMFYMPTAVVPPYSHSFLLPMAPPDFLPRPKPPSSITEPFPPSVPSVKFTPAVTKQQPYPYTPVWVDNQQQQFGKNLKSKEDK